MASADVGVALPKTAPVAVAPGTVIANKFRVEGPLSVGPNHLVLAARGMSSNTPVAVKIMGVGTSERRVAMRFARASKIESYHLPANIDVGSMPDGRPYVVMEYLEGTSVRDLLASGPFQVALAVDCIMQVCDALAAAHAIGVAHRRLTTSSLFQTDRAGDGAPFVKVLNFTSVTKPEEQVADLNEAEYMAPEVLEPPEKSSDIDRRCDIWAVGIILYELLTGARPFSAKNLEKLTKRVRSDSPKSARSLRKEIPAALDAVIQRALEKAPAARWQSVSELAQALAPFASPLTRDMPDRIARRLWASGSGSGADTDAPTTVKRAAPESSASGSDAYAHLDRPAFDQKPEDDVGFRKMMSDGRIEGLDSDSAAALSRMKRVAHAAAALQREGPRVSVPSEDTGRISIMGLSGPANTPRSNSSASRSGSSISVPGLPSIGPNNNVVTPPMSEADAEARRKLVVYLVLAIAVIAGLLFGVVWRMLMIAR